MLSAPTFLPAVLALLDRSAYRPARPKASDTSVEGRGGGAASPRSSTAATRRAWALTALVLAAFALSPAPRAGHRRARRTGAGRKIVVVLKNSTRCRFEDVT
ncbi:hypothetical protein ACFQ1B_37000 [Streptomyces mexicanus]